MPQLRNGRFSLFSLVIMLIVIFVTICFIQFTTNINTSVFNIRSPDQFLKTATIAVIRQHQRLLVTNGNVGPNVTKLLRAHTVLRSDDLQKFNKSLYNKTRQRNDLLRALYQPNAPSGRANKFNLSNGVIELKKSDAAFNGNQPNDVINVTYNDSHKYVIRHHVINETLIKKVDAKLQSDKKKPNYCPLWSSELVGPMTVSRLQNETKIPEVYMAQIQTGGKYKPRECEPRERTAIIIPYRDRHNSLMVLLRHLHMVLQRQKIQYAIYVVEMSFPAQFNRGLLTNVGFLTASSVAPYTCYVIHDVDLLMTDDRNMYRCGRVPRHLTATDSKFGKRLPYLSYFGGVQAFTPDQYWKVNGFSNLYFGSGGEDEDMVARIFDSGMHFTRPKSSIGAYITVANGNTVSEHPVNPHRKALIKTAAKRKSKDGVKSVSYYRLALEFKQLYTWIYIGVKEASIMQSFQDYIGDT